MARSAVPVAVRDVPAGQLDGDRVGGHDRVRGLGTHCRHRCIPRPQADARGQSEARNHAEDSEGGRPMGKEPEVIERDIERSRDDLSQDFDALAGGVSPKRVAGRQVEAVKGRFSGMKDKVMGPARSAGGTVSSAKDTVAEQAEGNPLAAGLVAFSAGWLVSSLIPA